MDGEQEAITPASEAPEAPIAAPEPQKIEDNLSPEVDEAPPVELDEFEEFDWEGKKVKGPKGLKEGVLRQADYTKKTQELSQTRKELDAERQRIAEQAKASEEEMKLRAKEISISEELEHYSKVDWAAWIEQDPIAANKAYFRQSQLKDTLNGVKQQISESTQKRTSEAQREFAKRMEETQEYARKNIKGWTPDTDRQVVEFAKEQGIDLGFLQSVMNPTVYRMLHLARLGHHALTTPAAPKPAPQSNVVPLETVAAKGNPPARLSPEDMTMEQYAAWRAKGGGTRRS